jgi:hypothetical protein
MTTCGYCGYGRGRVWSDLGTRPSRILALFIDTPDARFRLVRAAQLPCFRKPEMTLILADGVYSYRALWIQSREIGFTSPEGFALLSTRRAVPPHLLLSSPPSAAHPPRTLSFSRGEVLLLPHRAGWPADRTKQEHKQEQSTISTLRSPVRK